MGDWHLWGLAAPWWVWPLGGVVLVVGLVGCAYLVTVWLEDRADDEPDNWCDDCGTPCTGEQECGCCAGQVELRPLPEAGTLGEWDDGEPVTGGLRAIDPDESWPQTLHEINERIHQDDDGGLELVQPVYADLSEDISLLCWDAERQVQLIRDCRWAWEQEMRALGFKVGLAA